MAFLLNTLAYAQDLREAGFTKSQAEGQARALTHAMTDALATKQDLAGLETRFEELEKRLETRFEELEKRIALRLQELEHRHDRRLDTRLAELERRMTVRLLGGIAVVSALVRIL